MMNIEKAKIVSNERIKGDFFLLVVSSPKIAKSAMPGQFVNILVSDQTDPLLRRPFSIYDADASTGELKVIYFVKGKGTEILKSLGKGETLSITGPHGNSFPIVGDNILLVGGGFGVAPLNFFAKKNQDKQIYTAVGGKNELSILCHDDFLMSCKLVTVNTDDGTTGKRGLVTQGVNEIMEKHQIDSILTVGPIPMMRAVSDIAKTAGIPCFVSMEERMSCAIGVCFGCAVKTNKGMQRVCADGTIFSSEDIVW